MGGLGVSKQESLTYFQATIRAVVRSEQTVGAWAAEQGPLPPPVSLTARV